MYYKKRRDKGYDNNKGNKVKKTYLFFFFNDNTKQNLRRLFTNQSTRKGFHASTTITGVRRQFKPLKFASPNYRFI